MGAVESFLSPRPSKGGKKGKSQGSNPFEMGGSFGAFEMGGKGGSGLAVEGALGFGSSGKKGRRLEDELGL